MVGDPVTKDVDGDFIEGGVSRELVLPPADDLDRDEASQRSAEVFAALAPLITPLSFEVVLMAYEGEDREPIALRDPL